MDPTPDAPVDQAQRLQDAIQRKDAPAVARILQADPALATKPLPGGLTPLMLAAYLRATPVLDAVRPHVRSLDIFEASVLDDADRVRAILAQHAEATTAYSADGWTPLHLAAHFGSTAAIAALIDAGADAADVSRNAQANTPLHAAAAGGSHEAVAVLVAAGASVDARAAGGYTPLHVAAASGFERIVKALLDAGADTSAVDDEGRTPRQQALENEADEVLPLLPPPG